MVLCDKSVITNTCKFLGASPPGKISFNPVGEAVLDTKGSGTVTGFATVLETIIKGCQKHPGELFPSGAEEIAQLRQWLEFCTSVVNFADSQAVALKELNNRLAEVNFLISSRITVVDAILFYIIYPVMSGASMQEKENLSHVSRWFSTVQHTPGLLVASEHKRLTFSRNHLYKH